MPIPPLRLTTLAVLSGALAVLLELSRLFPAAAQQDAVVVADADLAAIDTPAEIVARVSELLLHDYVFEDKARECAERLAHDLARGAFDDLFGPDAMARALTDALQDVTRDKHLRVVPRPPGPHVPRDGAPDDEQERARMHERGRASNFGFEQVLRLEENVALIDLREFAPVEVARDTAVGAMQFVGNCDALVFDLRANGGGNPEMVQLIQSYLFDEPTHLNSLYWRRTDELVEYWTLDEVPGRRMADVPVIVITGPHTFSAAEEFTYNLKCRGRATVVGATTGGGAHPGGRVPVNEHLAMFVPSGRAINPVSGTNWEGTGVAPDVEADAAGAFDVAVALAVEQARAHREARARSSP